MKREQRKKQRYFLRLDARCFFSKEEWEKKKEEDKKRMERKIRKLYDEFGGKC